MKDRIIGSGLLNVSAVPIDPGTVGSLTFRLRSDSNVTRVGTAVTSWTDTVGARQIDTLGGSPTYVSSDSDLGGAPAIEFDGNDGMRSAVTHNMQGMFAVDEGTILLLHRIDSALINGTEVMGSFGLISTVDSGRRVLLIDAFDNSTVFQFGNPVGGNLNTPGYPDGWFDQYNVIAYRRGSDSRMDVWFNGIVRNSDSGFTATVPNHAANINIGDALGGTRMDGRYAEIMTFDEYLSNGEIEGIQQWLIDEYGL